MEFVRRFEYAGAAAHPGMLKIAEAIFEKMKPMLKGEEL